MAQAIQRHTIYDAMAMAGVFDLNPANASARDYETGEVLYKGPVQFPKMLYHPKGELRQIVPPNYVVNPVKGPIATDEQWELIHALAEGPEAEERLLAEGWHHDPQASHSARDGRPVTKSAAQKTQDLVAENARLVAQIAELTKAKAK